MQKRLSFILLNGAMGSGKSTIASLLRRQMDRTAILSIEDIRRLVTGGEDNGLAWKVIYRMCDEYFRNGVSVLLQQTVASQDIVNEFLQLARKHKCGIGFYHLRAPKAELLRRIKRRKKAGNVSRSLIARNIRKQENIAYASAVVIDTAQRNPGEVARLIMHNLTN